jgi:hypothetical protein
MFVLLITCIRVMHYLIMFLTPNTRRVADIVPAPGTLHCE